MHSQLSLLMEIQDLRTKLKEITSTAEELEAQHFNVDVDSARDSLQQKIDELVDRLDDPVRRRYEQIAPQRDRVVAPVINGVCYGCFVSIPTAAIGEQETRETLQSCQHCGVFIYVAS